jgi:hypothetical protein
MVMEIFMGNLPRTGCAALFIAWEKKSQRNLVAKFPSEHGNLGGKIYM